MAKDIKNKVITEAELKRIVKDCELLDEEQSAWANSIRQLVFNCRYLKKQIKLKRRK